MSHLVRATTERVSLLGPKSTLRGNFATTEELVILGQLDGGRVQASDITIGPAARVTAQIHAQTIRIGGAIDGDVQAPKVALMRGTQLRGRIMTRCPPQAETALDKYALEAMLAGAHQP